MTRRAWIAFAAVSLLWGFPYLFIKVAIDGGMTALPLAWARVVLGAAVLMTLAWRAGTLAPLRERGRWLVAFAVAEIAIPFPMIATAENHIASSTTAIAIATVPLIIAALTLRFEPSERVGGRRLVGMLVGLVGVAALVGLDVSGSGSELLGIGAALIAAAGYASGAMLLKRHLSDLDPIASMGVSLAIAAAILTPFAAADLPSTTPSAGAFGSIVVLGLLCTALAMVLMAILIDEAGPSRGSLITYINPVIAVALGIAFLGERPGPGAFAGLALILAGSWVATGGRLPAALERRRRATRATRLQ